MKFKIETATFATALTAVAKAVPAKPRLAILSNYLLELSKGVLRITASDGEIALRACARPDECDEKGSTAVPAKILLDLVKTLPAGNVTLELAPGAESVHVTWATGESDLPAFAPGDYIDIAVPKKEDAKSFETTTDVLVGAIGKTIASASTDSERRPTLCGIFFDIRAGRSNLVASDASRLVSHELLTPTVDGDAPFICPSKAAGILKSILPKDQNVTVVFDDKNARFAFGNIELTTRLVVGKYPKWRTIIPTQNNNVLSVNKQDLLNTLQRMVVLAEKKTSIVKVNLSFNQMAISAEDLGMALRGCEKLACDYDGADMQIGLKATTFIDTLASFDAEQVEIRFMDEAHAVLVRPTGEKASEEPFEAVVMPYKLTA